MHYGDKLRQKTYDKLMAEPGFLEFAKQEHEERVRVGCFCVRNTLEKDVFDNVENYEDQWEMRRLMGLIENNDPTAIAAMNTALNDVLDEFKDI